MNQTQEKIPCVAPLTSGNYRLGFLYFLKEKGDTGKKFLYLFCELTKCTRQPQRKSITSGIILRISRSRTSPIRARCKPRCQGRVWIHPVARCVTTSENQDRAPAARTTMQVLTPGTTTERLHSEWHQEIEQVLADGEWRAIRVPVAWSFPYARIFLECNAYDEMKRDEEACDGL